MALSNRLLNKNNNKKHINGTFYVTNLSKIT